MMFRRETPEMQLLVTDSGCEVSAQRSRSGARTVASVLGVVVLVVATVALALAWKQPAVVFRGTNENLSQRLEFIEFVAGDEEDEVTDDSDEVKDDSDEVKDDSDEVKDDAEPATEKPTSKPWPTTECSKKDDNCIKTGCCEDKGLTCFANSVKSGPHGAKAACKEKGSSGEYPFITDFHQVNGVGDTTWEHNGKTCHSRFVAPEVALSAEKHNGITLPDVCIKEKDEHHVFVIAEWGGVWNSDMESLKPADLTNMQGRRMVHGIDDKAQLRVAKQMAHRAAKSNPDYVINAGNSFRGGVDVHCGAPVFHHAKTDQWWNIFENVYKGEGLDNKQWLGVLGNEDYGSSMYVAGWDQTIGYTWGGPLSSGRWMIPAQYYRAVVRYPTFSVEYYFIDTSYMKKGELCAAGKNKPLDHCRTGGPPSEHACSSWFDKYWKEQLAWMGKLLKNSMSDWQIVVTTFPPFWGTYDWKHLSRTHGIDLIISGDKHQQEVHNVHDKFGTIHDGWGNLYTDFMHSTAWLVSGGGGGATSILAPHKNGEDDQYGFIDLTFKEDAIIVEMISHGGHVRKTSTVRKRIPAITRPDYIGHLTAEELERDKPDEHGCPKKQTYYVYRVQDDKNYPDKNINAASLAGVLWYLHHEVVIVCPRKFGATRIRRMKVTMQNPCDLYKRTKSNFGPFQAYDSGQCNNPDCPQNYRDYGFVVGCQHMPIDKGIFAAYCDQPNTTCRYPHWYSFPGPCPSHTFDKKNDNECKREHGGWCENVTGKRDCTYNIEKAGELSLDEIYTSTGPSHDWNQFCSSGKLEYNNQTDHGQSVSFWNGIYSPQKCNERYDTIQRKFKEKYPDMPVELNQPHCDYFKSDPIGNFLYNTGSGFSRTAQRTDW